MYSTSERYKKAISRDIQWWESKLVIDGTEYFDFMKLDGKLGICAEEHGYCISGCTDTRNDLICAIYRSAGYLLCWITSVRLQYW